MEEAPIIQKSRYCPACGRVMRRIVRFENEGQTVSYFKCERCAHVLVCDQRRP